MTTKVTTLRLPAELSAALTAVALIDGLSRAEVIRQALAQHVGRRIADAEFRSRWEAFEAAAVSGRARP